MKTILKRPKILIYIACSIDGFIARQDGSIDWLEEGHTGNEDYGFKKFMKSVDAVIMGKNTYEVISKFDEWPYPDKKVIVLSSSLNKIRKEAKVYNKQLDNLLNTLHTEGINHVWVDGGITLSKFINDGLIDEITITKIPVILGSGIPLFNSIKKEQRIDLINAQSYPSGLVQLKYKLTN
ncbi:MAG: putative protein YyaP [Chlamydiia bacterium]|nr:putative protein YyaP [Chlamydiia bacterium]